jgi:hypothetical protein
MKYGFSLYLTAATLCLALPLAAQNLEGAVAPVFNPARELQSMQMVPVCPPNTPVVVSGTRFVCGTRTTQSCTVGQYVRAINADGTLVCAPLPSQAPACASNTPVIVSRGVFSCGAPASCTKPAWIAVCNWNWSGKGNDDASYYGEIYQNPSDICARNGRTLSRYFKISVPCS